MKFVYSLVMLSCVLWEARGYSYYPSYGNVDSYSLGAGRSGIASGRYYNPRAAVRQHQRAPARPYFSQYQLPKTRRQALDEANFINSPQQSENVYPQQPEGFYPQQPDNQALVPNAATELIDVTEKAAEVAPTTVKAVAVPEIVEPELETVPEEESVPKLKKTVSRKQVKIPVDEDDEEDDYVPKMPTGAYFPMFFGWGGRSGGSPGNGPTAIANSFSTGRGGASTSHATAYGEPRPQERNN